MPFKLPKNFIMGKTVKVELLDCDHYQSHIVTKAQSDALSKSGLKNLSTGQFYEYQQCGLRIGPNTLGKQTDTKGNLTQGVIKARVGCSKFYQKIPKIPSKSRSELEHILHHEYNLDKSQSGFYADWEVQSNNPSIVGDTGTADTCLLTAELLTENGEKIATSIQAKNIMATTHRSLKK